MQGNISIIKLYSERHRSNRQSYSLEQINEELSNNELNRGGLFDVINKLYESLLETCKDDRDQITILTIVGLSP